MAGSALELPLNYSGHSARVVVTPADEGGWDVRTEVDERTLGYEHFVKWLQVERFVLRMQAWVEAAQRAERYGCGHLQALDGTERHAC